MVLKKDSIMWLLLATVTRVAVVEGGKNKKSKVQNKASFTGNLYSIYNNLQTPSKKGCQMFGNLFLIFILQKTIYLFLQKTKDRPKLPKLWRK